MTKSKSVRILTAQDVKKNLQRMAREIVRQNKSSDSLAFISIRTRGLFLAKRLCAMIGKSQGKEVPLGEMDITLYRDDLSTLGEKPVVQKSELEIPIVDKSVVMIEDVLYTGRTTRAAMDALFRSGRPKRVQLCVLIDRGHRELPIEAAFVGRKVQTTDSQIIEVKLREIDDAEKVLLMEKQ